MAEKRNKLADPLDYPYLNPWIKEIANRILECEKHGQYRQHQAAYSNITCPTCHAQSEEDYYSDSRRYSYWPGD